jgi:hypothetical protein
MGQMMSLRRAYTFGLMSLILLPMQAFAQGYVVDGGVSDPSGSIHGAVLPVNFGGPFDNGYFWARGDFGDRPGANGNFFTTGLFAPIQIYGPEELFFVQGQLWVNEHSNIGGDVGIGQRWLFSDYSQAIGVNAFITWDKSQADNRYRQFGFGAEWLTDYLELTSNVYLPWRERSVDVGPPLLTNQLSFTGQNLAFLNLQNVEQQSTGFDIEVGSPIPGMEWLSAYAGFYHFAFDDARNASGISGRATMDLTNAMLGVSVQDDSRFGTTVSGFAELRLGSGPLNFVPRYRNLTHKIREQVRRRQFIATQQFIDERDELAINPTTGNPYTFAHVDNTAAPGGNGTFEAMYDNLSGPSGSAVDIILVHRGTTDSGTLLPGNDGLFLTNNQIVLGEGQVGLAPGTVINGQIFINNDPAVQLITTNRPNPVDLPGWDTTGDNPFVTANANANIINLANNNAIIGLNMISPAGGNMIRSQGITDFFIADINQNIGPMDNTGPGGGIFLTNAGGIGNIERFNMRSTSPASTGGIVIRNSATPDLELSIRDSEFLEGGAYGIDLVTSNTSVIDAVIQDVNADQNGTGIRLHAQSGGQTVATIVDSTFTNAVNHGIRVRGFNNGEVQLVGTNIDASGAGIDGLHVNLLDNATATVLLDDLSVENAGRDGVHAELSNGSELTLGLASFTATNAGRHGLRIEGQGGSVFDAEFVNGSFADAQTGDGVSIVLDDSTGNLVLNNTNANNAGGNGFLFDLDNGATFDAALLNGISLDDAGISAVNGTLAGGSTATIFGNGVSGANAWADAIRLDVTDSDLELLFINTGSFANAGQGGVGSGLNLTQDGGTVTIEISNNPPVDFSNPATHGLFANVTGGGEATILFPTGANFDNPQNGSAIHLEATDGSDLFVSGTAVSGANAHLDAIFVHADDSLVNLMISQAGSFENPGQSGNGHGINFNAINGSDVNIAISAPPGGPTSSFDGAQGNGVIGNLDASLATLSLVDTSFENARDEGMGITAVNNSLFGGLVVDSSFTGAGDNGIRITLDESDAFLTLDNTNANDNGGTGLLVQADNESNAIVEMFNGVSFDDSGDMGVGNAIGLIAGNDSTIDVFGEGVSGANAADDAIFLFANNASLINLELIDAGSFQMPGGNGISFTGLAGSELGIAIEVDPTVADSFIDAGGNGVVGVLDDSEATLILVNTDFTNAALEGFALDAVNDSLFVGSVTDGSFAEAGNNGVRMTLDDSQALLILDNTNANDNGGTGLLVQADNESLAQVGLFNGVSFDDSGNGNAISLNAFNQSAIQVFGEGVSGARATDDAIFADAQTSSFIELELVNSGSFDTPQGNGIRFNGEDNSEIHILVHVDPAIDDSFIDAAENGVFGTLDNSLATLDLVNTDFTNATENGFLLNAVNDSTFIGSVVDGSFSEAGMNGVEINLDESVAQLTLDNTDADDNNGFGLLVNADNQSTAIVNLLNGISFDNSGDAGVGSAISLNADNNSAIDVSGDGVSGTNAETDAIFISSLGGSSVNLDLDNAGDFTNAGDNGLAAFTSGTGSQATININGADFSDPGERAIFLNAENESQIVMTGDELSGARAQLDAIALLADNAGIDLTLTNAGDFSDAGQAGGADGSGLAFSGINGAVINIDISGDPADLAEFSGAFINGVLGELDDSLAILTLTDVDFSDPGQEGMGITAINGSAFGGSATNVDFSGAQGGDAIRLDLNDSMAEYDFNDVNASSSAGNGLIVDADSNSTAILTIDGLNLDESTDSAINLIANDSSIITLSGSGASGVEAGADAISLTASDQSQIGLNLTDTGAFTTPVGNGIAFTGTNESVLNISIAADPGTPADFTQAGENGIIGVLNDSQATLTLTNVDFSDATLEGLIVDAQNGSIFNGSATNVDFSGAQGGDAIRLDLDDSQATYAFNNVDGSNNTGNGLIVNADTGSTATLTADGLNLDFSGDAGLGSAISFNADNISTITLTGSGVSGAEAQSDAIVLTADNESQIGLNLTDVGSFTTPGGNGIAFTGLNESILNISIAAADPGTPADFTQAGENGIIGVLNDSQATLTLTNVDFSDATLGGLIVDAENNSTFIGTATNADFSGAQGDDAIRLDLDESDGSLTLTNVDASSSAGNGLIVNSDNESNAVITANGLNLDDNTTANALSLNATGDSTLTMIGDDLSGANAGNHGIHVFSDESVTQIQLTNVGDFSNAGVDGVNITVNGGSDDDFFFGLSGTDNADRANFNDYGRDGLSITFNDYAGDPNLLAFDIRYADFNSDGTSTGNGFSLESDNSTFNGRVRDSSFDESQQHGFFANLNETTGTVSFENSTMTSAAVDAVHVNLTAPVTTTTFNLNIQNGDLTGAGNNAVDFTTDANSTFNLVINPTPIQADNNGINGDMTAGGTANISITGATGGTPIIAGNDGVNLQLDNGALANLNITDAPIQAGNSGIVLNLDDASTAGLLLTRSGIEFGTGDGLHVTAAGGSELNGGPMFTNARLTGSAINGNGTGGYGVVLDLDDASTAGINFLQTSTITNAGADNLRVLANDGSTANLAFSTTSGDLSNAGENGIFMEADGTDSTINAIFQGFLNLDNAGDKDEIPPVDGDGLSLIANTGGEINFTAINGVSIANANGHAINIEGDNGTFNVDLRRNSNAPINLDDATGSGVHVDITNESDLNFSLNGFSIDNAGEHGVVLLINDDSTASVQLSNGVISNSGTPVDLAHGILAVTNTGSNIDPGDSSFLALDLLNVNVLNNNGDGINLTANNGSSAVIPQQSGIALNYTGGLVDGNIFDPLSNELGYGMRVTSDGDNTLVVLNLNNVTVTSPPLPPPPGNEEPGNLDPAEATALGQANDASIRLDAINNGTILFNIDASTVQGPIVATSQFLHPAMDEDPASVPGGIIGTLNNTLILPSTDGGNPDAAAIVLGVTDGGFVDVTFSNMTGARAISGHGAQAVAFLALDGTINATFDNVEMTNNLLGDATVTQPITQAHLTALGVTDLTEADFENVWDGDDFGIRGVIQGYVGGTNAVVNMNLNNVTVNGNGGPEHTGPGFKLLVEDGGTFNANITNSDFFNNVAGIDPITGQPEGEFDVLVRGTDSSVNLNVVNTSASGSDGHGFNIVALDGGLIGNADATDFDHLAFTSDPGFDPDEDPIVRFNNVTANDATNNGLNILVDGAGSELAHIAITNSQFDNAGGDGISIVAENGGTLNEIFINPTSAVDAGGHGLNITGTSANVAGPINITGQPGDPSTFDGAGLNGVNINIQDQTADVNVTLDHVTTNNAGQDGVNVTLADLTGAGNVTLNNVTANGVNRNGIQIDMTDVAEASSIALTNVTANNAGVAGPPPVPGDGVNIRLENVGGGSTNSLSFDTVTTNSARGDGIEIRLEDNTVAEVAAFDNVVSQLNRENGLLFDISGGSVLQTFTASGLDLSNNSALSPDDAGLHVNVRDTGSAANFVLTDLTVNQSVSNFGKGVILNVEDDATLGFSVDGGIISGTGREGVVVNVGGTATPGSTFTGDFANINIVNGGTAPFVSVHGFDADVIGDGTTATFTFENVSVDNHITGDGFNFFVDEGATLDVALSNGTTGSNNFGRGFALLAEGAGTTVNLNSFADPGDPVNAFNNNGSHGFEVVLREGDPGDLLTANITNLQASANNNGGTGIRVIANDRSGVRIPSLGITADGVNVDNNQGNGLTVDLAEIRDFTSFDLSGMQVNNNVGDQINIRFLDFENIGVQLTSINLNDVVANGPGAGTTGPAGSGDGIRLTLDNTQVTDSLSLDRITAVNNRRDGLQINLRNFTGPGGILPVNSSINVPIGSDIDDGMFFDDNGRHGINIQMNNADARLDILNSAFLFGTTASASRNAGNGINIAIENGSDLTTNVDHLVMEDNGGHGFFVGTTGNSNFDNEAFTNNISSGNAGSGFAAQFLGGTYDLNIGSRTLPDRGNVFDDNGSHGVHVRMIQDSVGRIAIVDNQVTRSGGDGFFLEMVGTAVTPPATNIIIDDPGAGDPGLLIRNNLIGTDALTAGANLGNSGFGINFNVQEQSVIEGVEIVENAISFNGNGGIEFQRRDFVEVNDFFINTNFIEFNNGHGINLEGRNSATDLMTVTIGEDVNGNPFDRSDIVNWMNAFDGNVIRGNTNSGVRAFVMGDANLRVDMQENFIIQNQNNGVQLNENRLSGDQAQLFGTWDRNIISNNENRGFVSNARADLLLTDSIIGAVIDQFGDVFNDAELGLLHGNHSTGVEINGVGSYVLGQFMDQDSGIDILFNGRMVTADRTQGHGIDIQGATFKSVEVHNSRILRNFQDGVEIEVAGGTMDLLFTDNRVSTNAGRGYDVLVKGNSHLNLQILGTVDPRGGNAVNALATATSNGEEGIYIVNTPASAQNQSDFSTTALNQTGPVTGSGSTPTTNAVISQVDISFNGNDIPGDNANRPAGSGLVVRVGTSDARGPTVINDDGGFASTGSNPFTPTGRNNSRAGVVMQVDSNFVDGNFGDGMFFHGFRATPPSGTGSAWPNTGTINNSGYQSDPLARLDLIWGVAGNGTANEFAGGDALNANNVGSISPRRGNPDGQAGAFYQTTDQNFKSRVSSTNVFADNPGPFSINNRRRNAQRQGLRTFPDGTMLPPATNSNLLFPGMGQSVFRVSALSGNNEDLLPFQTGGLNGFNFDFNSDDNARGSIFGDGDFQGTSFTGSSGLSRGELPFGWGMFGPQTFDPMTGDPTTSPSGN